MRCTTSIDIRWLALRECMPCALSRFGTNSGKYERRQFLWIPRHFVCVGYMDVSARQHHHLPLQARRRCYTSNKARCRLPTRSTPAVSDGLIRSRGGDVRIASCGE